MKKITVNGATVEAYPLTAAQRIHNYSRMYCPRNELLNIGTGLYIKQDTDFNILREAIHEAYTRLDTMRLRFWEDPETKEVLQYLVPTDDREIEFVDFSKWKEEDAHNEMRRWTRIPFKRFNSPMNRVVMIKLPGGYNGIYFNVDHMTMDSSAIITFDRDVLELYCHKKYGTDMPKPMMSYIAQLEKDLAYEDNSPAKQRDTDYWMSRFAEGEPMYTDFTGMGRLLSFRRDMNDQSLRCARITSPNVDAAISIFELEKDPSDRLMKFCRENHVPVVCLLLMGLRTVLSKFNNDEKDISVNSCVARRGTLLEKRSGGTRIHFFPLRTIIEPETTFIDACRIMQDEQNKTFRHANFDSVEHAYRRKKVWNTAENATYESLSLTYQPMTLNENTGDIPDIPYKSFWYSNGVAAQPLYLTVMHRVNDNGLNFNFEYQKEVVTDHEMEYFYYYLCRVIFRGIENKNRTIGEILEMI
ncbi:MAG: condensation domain-containing protein [Huintestinicola sp.]